MVDELHPSEELAVRETLEVMVSHLEPGALPDGSRWRETFLNCSVALVGALEPGEPHTPR